MYTYGYTAKQIFDALNMCSECAIHFGFPRVRVKHWTRCQQIVRISTRSVNMNHGLDFFPYEQAEQVGYQGWYEIAGECVGFLTMDDRFVSIARCYNIDLQPPSNG